MLHEPSFSILTEVRKGYEIRDKKIKLPNVSRERVGTSWLNFFLPEEWEIKISSMVAFTGYGMKYLFSFFKVRHLGRNIMWWT